MDDCIHNSMVWMMRMPPRCLVEEGWDSFTRQFIKESNENIKMKRLAVKILSLPQAFCSMFLKWILIPPWTMNGAFEESWNKYMKILSYRRKFNARPHVVEHGHRNECMPLLSDISYVYLRLGLTEKELHEEAWWHFSMMDRSFIKIMSPLHAALEIKHLWGENEVQCLQHHCVPFSWSWIPSQQLAKRDGSMAVDNLWTPCLLFLCWSLNKYQT